MQLQAVQEGQEFVSGFIAPASSILRSYLRQGFFLHSKCCFEVHLCGFQALVTEAQCDHRSINTCLQKVHSHGVPETVHGDPFSFQRQAYSGSSRALLVLQVLDAIDAETFTFEVGEEHVSVASLGLT
jgi:hypothetical protein